MNYLVSGAPSVCAAWDPTIANLRPNATCGATRARTCGFIGLWSRETLIAFVTVGCAREPPLSQRRSAL